MVSVWPYGLRRGTVCLGGFLWSVREVWVWVWVWGVGRIDWGTLLMLSYELECVVAWGR